MNIQLIKISVAVACSMGIALSAQAASLDLSGKNFITFGDAQTYSLAALAIEYNAGHGGGVGPGNPYYITSTPGAIQDLVVLATGAGGTGVTTNVAGMDNAYSTPNGVSGSTFFTTHDTSSAVAPEPSAPFTGQQTTTWDTSLGVLRDFLGTGGAPVFFFNNNQIDSGAATNQNLAIWGQISITDPNGNLISLSPTEKSIWDLTNQNSPFALTTEGGGGVINGPVSNYTHPAGYTDPFTGTNSNTDYVFSGGKYCLNSVFLPVSCSSGTVVYGPISNNLGANQAAYAVLLPELNTELTNLFGAGGDLTGYAMHVDLRMGCDPATVNKAVDCVGRSLNNGYEQIFMGSTKSSFVNTVPEPASIALIGLGLLGVGWSMRGRRV